MKGRIAGIGAALVDSLLEESDAFLEKMGAAKGGMTLVEEREIAAILSSSEKLPSQVPGGSACNTLVGISRMGGAAEFVGRVGGDDRAGLFSRGLQAAGVQARLLSSDSPTGHVLSVVTPDAQRSMFTFLGASAELTPEDLEDSIFERVEIVHIEGYLAFNESVFRRVLQLAEESGAVVSLDLSSFDVVNAKRELLDEALREGGVHIVIANEDEALAYTGKKERKALDILAEICEVAVVKMGARGAYVKSGKNSVHVKADEVQALDTTGAGDLWATGFLYAFAKGVDLERSAQLGATVAAEVVQVLGAVIPPAGWERIAAKKEKLSIL